MRKYSFYLFISIPFLLLSCFSAKQKFEKGKYDQAFDLALKRLEKGKGDKSDKNILNRSFRELVDESQANANTLLETNNPDNWELAYAGYDAVNKRFDAGRKYLVSTQEPLNQTIKSEKQNLEKRIVDTLMQIGQYNLDYAIRDNKKWLAQYAYQQFRKTQSYRQIPGIDTLIQDCIDYGTYIYIVDADADFASSYRWEIDRQFDDLANENFEFIRIFYDQYVNNADCDIEIRFRRLDFDVKETVKTNQYTKKVLDGYKTVVDESGNETKEAIYKDVSAEVKDKELTKTASWECALDAKPASQNCRKRDKYFNRSYSSKIHRYEISGDARAVPDQYKNQTMQEFEDEGKMVAELINLLYRDVRNYLSILE